MVYDEIATGIKIYLRNNKLGNLTKEDYEEKYVNFLKEFSPKNLANLEGNEVRDKIFPHDNDKSTLSFNLAYSNEYKGFCGDIDGDSEYNFYLFKNGDTGDWTVGSSIKNEVINEEKSIDIAKDIRDAIVEGAEYIKKNEFKSINDYVNLGKALKDIFNDYPINPEISWIHKYYSIVFPDIIPIIHQKYIKKDMLNKLHIEPKTDLFENDGQLALLSNEANIKLYSLFDESIVGLFYKWDKDMLTDKFDRKNLIDEYKKIVSVGNKMTIGSYGLLNVNERNIWKITLSGDDKTDEFWNTHKEGGIHIGFSSEEDIDASIDSSYDESIKEFSDFNPENIQNANIPQMIWNFVNKFKENDIIVANNGLNGKIYGIGIIGSDNIRQSNDIEKSRIIIPKVNWIFTEVFDTNIKLDSKIITKLNDETWNSIVKSILEFDENIKKESLKAIWNEFKNNYYTSSRREKLHSKYSECSEKFKVNFENIKMSINDGCDEKDSIFYNLIDSNNLLFEEGGSGKKQMIKKNYNRSEDELSQIAYLYLNLIDNYTTTDEKLRHEIYEYDNNQLSNSIKTANVSSSLYFLDNNRFYSINQKTIKSIRFLSNYIDININFDNKLINYIDNNIKYHKYINEIIKYLPELNTFETFDHFCYWLCDKKLGYYADGGRLPLCIKNFNENSASSEIIETRAFNINSNNIKTNLKINKNTLYQAAAILNSSKNIIFEGVPGTGKTVLAKDICEHAKTEHFCNNYIITTATSDWTTYDVIGGLMPDVNGNLNFEEGIFLKAIRENNLLIIDEINRADIDKAFGQLFTVLSGSNVELNYKIDDNNIKIDHTDNLESYYDNSSKTYYIGKNFRILATMNNYDKDSLYELSYAFMRRFAFIEVDIPNDEEYKSLIDKWNDELLVKLPQEYIENIKLLLKLNQYRKLGPAIYYDIIQYLENRLKFESDSNILEEVILSFILPQFEGLSKNKLKEIKTLLVENNLVNESVIEEKFEELLGLNF